MIFTEVDLPDSLVAELSRIIPKMGYKKKLCDAQDYDASKTKEFCAKRVTPEALVQIQEGQDRNVATADENMLRLPPELIKETPLPVMFEELVKDICQVGNKEYIFHVTGKFWYPKNGYMGWHTNNAYPGFRFYCTHAQRANRSFFRYQDPDTKEIITSWDKKGWMGRLFLISKDKPLWHCVYSETNRISTGCNVEVDTNYSLNWEKLGGRA